MRTWIFGYQVWIMKIELSNKEDGNAFQVVRDSSLKGQNRSKLREFVIWKNLLTVEKRLQLIRKNCLGLLEGGRARLIEVAVQWRSSLC